ncbi:MAG TPA: SDR family oxidoreductase [Candidatus Binataceae bacterium]|jgi:2-deoxy-D-gluconate 3-dehydrogenase|nr:SDR family oxidoreductase [Candidatus Binataceae bacterium]
MAPAKMFDLSGKVAIVTGGNRGIGRGLALGLAEAGAAVAILARDEEKNQATLKELQALGVPAMARRVDLKQRRELKPAFDEVERKLGAADIMVNNAAYATLTSVLETSEEDWDGVLSVNLSAAFLFCKYAAQSMIKRGARGKIINVTSLAAAFGSAVFPSYAVTKGGLAQLTRSLAIELAPHNIQVNALAPGWVSTDMTEWIRTGPEYDWLLKEMVQRTPRGRFAEPEELKGAVVFLASSASDNMTGADLLIDGGFSIR